MNGVLMPLLLTLDNYLLAQEYLSLEIIKLARCNITGCEKILANSILGKSYYYELTNSK